MRRYSRLALTNTLKWGEQKLSSLSISNPRMEALWILVDSYPSNQKINPIDLAVNPNGLVPLLTVQKFKRRIFQRLKGIPLAYLLRFQEFMGLSFQVNKNTLIPRQETEILIEAALKNISKLPSPNIIEIGTGSGNIAVTLAKKNPRAKIVTIDISEVALKIARANAKTHGVEAQIQFLHGNLFSPLQQLISRDADLIVSNPPYIPSNAIRNLQTEIQHEPLTALDGGKDGLQVIRSLILQSPPFLKKGGCLMLEVGFDQSKNVISLMKQAGYAHVCSIRDYLGHERVVKGQKHG